MFAIQIKIGTKWKNWAVRDTEAECQDTLEKNKNVLSNCTYRITEV